MNSSNTTTNTTKYEPKKIVIYSENDARFRWDGTANDLVDDFISDAEERVSDGHERAMELFAWMIAAIADGQTDRAEEFLNEALGRVDLTLELN